MKIFNFLIAVLFVASLYSCVRNEEKPKGFEKGRLDVELSAKVGSKDLVLNDSVYVNEKGNKFTVSMFKYYVTNIHLIDNQGNKFLVPNSYCLFDQGEAGAHTHRIEHGNTAHLDSARVGVYDSIQVMIGVDVLKNHAVGNRGALDPAKGMFWNWNTGYIFVRFEGSYLKDSLNVAGGDSVLRKSLIYHVGFNSNARTIKMKLPTRFEIKDGQKSTLKLEADILEMFKNPNLVDFEVSRNSMAVQALQTTVANNYVNMLKVKGVTNP